MFTTYVLISLSGERTYVGHCEDFDVRLNKHNAGHVRSTKSFRPWLALHFEEHSTRGEAMNRERWFKSPMGRKFIKGLIAKRK